VIGEDDIARYNSRRYKYLCETGILLLALSGYINDLGVIDHCILV
jgi:hypothetical protein